MRIFALGNEALWGEPRSTGESGEGGGEEFGLGLSRLGLEIGYGWSWGEVQGSWGVQLFNCGERFGAGGVEGSELCWYSLQCGVR